MGNNKNSSLFEKKVAKVSFGNINTLWEEEYYDTTTIKSNFHSYMGIKDGISIEYLINPLKDTIGVKMIIFNEALQRIDSIPYFWF